MKHYQAFPSFSSVIHSRATGFHYQIEQNTAQQVNGSVAGQHQIELTSNHSPDAELNVPILIVRTVHTTITKQAILKSLTSIIIYSSLW